MYDTYKHLLKTKESIIYDLVDCSHKIGQMHLLSLWKKLSSTRFQLVMTCFCEVFMGCMLWQEALLVLAIESWYLDKSFLLPWRGPDHGSHHACPEWPKCEDLSLLTSTYWTWIWLPGQQENDIFKFIFLIKRVKYM